MCQWRYANPQRFKVSYVYLQILHPSGCFAIIFIPFLHQWSNHPRSHQQSVQANDIVSECYHQNFPKHNEPHMRCEWQIIISAWTLWFRAVVILMYHKQWLAGACYVRINSDSIFMEHNVTCAFSSPAGLIINNLYAAHQRRTVSLCALYSFWNFNMFEMHQHKNNSSSMMCYSESI